MKEHRLSLFLGMPITFNSVKFHSPTMEKIAEYDESQYRWNYLFAAFDKQKILENVLKLSDERLEELSEVDDYEVLTSEPELAVFIANALSFFVEGEFTFNLSTNSFDYSDDELKKENIINSNNYKELVELIHLINGSLDSSKEKKIVYKNNKAKELAKELEKMRKKNKKNDDGLDIKDLLSILCTDSGNGINVFNAHNLTIYQVNEQIERLGIKYNRETVIPLWANGNLKEGTKLPELFVKTKF